jgi:ABC-type phosphate/phosphonate transport system substrate-binding protein
MSACIRRAGLSALAALAICTALAGSAEEKNGALKALKVGISRSVFFEEPDAVVKAAMPMWATLVKSQAGIQAEFNAVDTDRLAQELVQRDVDMGVFQGYEFAWAAQQDRELRPLVIVVNQKPYLTAAFIVRHDTKIKDIAGLQGQTLALPKGRRAHVRLYFQRICQALGKEPNDSFGKLAQAPSSEDALDDVVDGAAQATVVDTAYLDCYQRRKPGRFRMIKVLAQSPVFPDPVIAYRAGAIDAKTVEQFRDGMLRSDQDSAGRQVLTFFKITNFGKVPDDYEKVTQEIARTYPPALVQPGPTEKK